MEYSLLVVRTKPTAAYASSQPMEMDEQNRIGVEKIEIPTETRRRRRSTGFTGVSEVLLGFTGFSKVLLGFTGFYWVLLGFTEFYWVLLGFTGFYRVLPSFSSFRVLLGFT